MTNFITAVDEGRDKVARIENAIAVPIALRPDRCAAGFEFAFREYFDEVRTVEQVVQVGVAKPRALQVMSPEGYVGAVDSTVSGEVVGGVVIARSRGDGQEIDVSQVVLTIVIEVTSHANVDTTSA